MGEKKGNLNFAFCTVAFVQMSFFPEGFLGVKIVVEFGDINSQRERDFIKAFRGRKPDWK